MPCRSSSPWSFTSQRSRMGGRGCLQGHESLAVALGHRSTTEGPLSPAPRKPNRSAALFGGLMRRAHNLGAAPAPNMHPSHVLHTDRMAIKLSQSIARAPTKASASSSTRASCSSASGAPSCAPCAGACVAPDPARARVGRATLHSDEERVWADFRSSVEPVAAALALRFVRLHFRADIRPPGHRRTEAEQRGERIVLACVRPEALSSSRGHEIEVAWYRLVLVPVPVPGRSGRR